MKRNIIKRVMAFALSLIMVIGLMPTTAFASDNFPGKPDGMSVSGATTETWEGRDVWLCPDKNGSIQRTETGDGYVIYEAIPNGGYVFSYWATWCVSDDWYDSWGNSNAYYQDDGKWVFSKPASSGNKYKEKDSKIRINKIDSGLTEYDADRYYLYAVFVKQGSVSIKVEGGGATFYAKNMSNYTGTDYEMLCQYDSESANFTVPYGISVCVTIELKELGTFEKILVNGEDRTSELVDIRDGYRFYENPVESELDIRIITSQPQYTITYHGTGGTTVDGSDTYTQNYGHYDSPNLTANQFSLDSKTFVGWSTKQDSAEVSYQDRQKFDYTGNLDLYAIWADSVYEVTYRGNGGTIADEETEYTQEYGYGTEATIKDNEFVYASHTFVGWNTEPDGTGVTYQVGQQIGPNQNLVLYAIWADSVYEVTYRGNGGTIADEETEYTQEYSYGTIAALADNKFENVLHTFVGWNTEPDGTGVTYQVGQQIGPNQNLVLYAIWADSVYEVTYRGNGGTIADEETEYTQEYGYGTEATIKDNEFVYASHTFVGWNTEPDGTGVTYQVGQQVGPNQNLVLYAIWKENPVITYYGNGGKTPDGETEYVQEYSYGAKATLADNKFVYDSFVFLGWNTEPDGTGVTYQAGQQVGPNQDLTLFAIWDDEEHYVFRMWDETKEEVIDEIRIPSCVLTEVTSTTTTLDNSWYIVYGDVTVDSRISVNGEVNLIIADGATLTVNGGIHLSEGNTLNVYGQKLGSGKLIANATAVHQAGIGGNDEENCGSLNIHGGNVEASALVDELHGAGIGGGRGGHCGVICIYGGNVSATGNRLSVGIGSNSYSVGGVLNIYGGYVQASGGDDETNGIGASSSSTGCTVNIYGGDVVATGTAGGGGRDGGAGIGGDAGTKVNIHGGTITATGGSGAAGIGGVGSESGIDVVITGGNVKAIGGRDADDIGAGDGGSDKGSLTDGQGNSVSLTTITLEGATEGTVVTAVTGITGYGLNDVKTLDTNKLYFYLPAGSTPTSVTAGGTDYSGTVKDGEGTFAEHTHSFEYTASQNKVVETCTPDCGHTATAELVVDDTVDTVYTGSAIKALKVVYSDNWQGGNLEITYSSNVNAGTANGAITIGGATATQTFAITAAPMPNVSAQGYSGTYDGQAHSITVNAPAGATVSYKVGDGAYSTENPAFKDAGTYTVAYKVSMANYADAEGTATVKIDKASLTVTANDHRIKYGEAPSNNGVTCSGFIGSDTMDDLTGTLGYVYTYSQGDNVGSYEITPSGLTAKNYEITFKSGTLTVDKTDAIFTVPTANDVRYTGKMQELVTAGTVNGGKMVFSFDEKGGYSETLEAKEVGIYIVWYKVVGDANHSDSVPASIKVEIKKATPDLGTVSVDGIVYDTTKPEDVVLTQTGTVSGTFKLTDSAMLADKTVYNYTFTPSDSANYNSVYGQVAIDVQDTVVPDAIISVDEHKWTFWDTITFGLFYNESKEVTITYADNENGSGLKDTLYYVADKEMTADELNDVEWTTYTKAFDIDPDGKYVIYAKAVDNDGNTLVINSNGLVLDKTQAVVEGLTNGGAYYGQLVFTVADELAGMKSVVIDGSDETHFEGQYVINADNAEHTVVVTDNAGNVTEYKVTVYKNYTVTYKIDGEVISTQTVGHGKDATAPKIPEKVGYVGKWDADGKNVTGDTTINSVYTEIPVSNPDSPQTGDNSNLWLWVALLFISGGAVVTLTVVDRKKRYTAKH